MAVDMRINDNQAATIVVAAHDSLHPERADYVCDGTDDQVQIQAAIDALPAVGGKVLNMEGNYNVKNTITVGDNTTVEFMPGNTVTIPADHTLAGYTHEGDTVSTAITNDDHTGGNDHVFIVGANIDFNGDNGKTITQTWAGIWLNNCTESNIIDCDIYDVVYGVNRTVARAYGVVFTACTYCKMIDCDASRCGYEGFGVRGDNDHILVSRCSGTGNYAHLGQGSAWLGTTDDPSYVVFDSCYGDSDIIFHGTLGGIKLREGVIKNCIVDKVSIKGDVINIVSTGNIITLDNIYLNETGDGEVKNIIVDSNTIYRESTGGPCILCEGVSSGTIKNVSITNNNAYNGRIEARNTSAAEFTSFVITGNNCINIVVDTPAIKLSIAGTGSIQDVDISHNNMQESARHFIDMIIAGDGDIKNVTLSNNNVNCNRFINSSKTSGAGVIQHLKITNNNLYVSTTVCLGGTHLSNVIMDSNRILYANYLYAGAIDDIFTINNYFGTLHNFDNALTTNKITRGNHGYITENSGTATLANGTTSIVVTHGLAVTPAAGDIVVTPIEAWGNMTQFYIDTYTSTQFTIHADINPGQDVDFAWKAIVL